MGQIHGSGAGNWANTAMVTDTQELLVTGSVVSTPISVSDANPQVFEDTSFVVGDSPATLDANAALGRNATEFSVINDGAGDFSTALSNNGISFGGEHTMKTGETYSVDNYSLHTIRITHINDSSYRVVVL